MSKEESYTNLIIKYLTDALSAAEADKLERWVQASDKNQALFDDYKKVWQEAENQMPSEIRNIDLESEWQKFEQEAFKKTSKAETGKKIIRIMLSAAAGVAVLWALIFYFRDTKQTLYAENTVKEVVLPDSSKLTANTGTTIKYPGDFEHNRELELSGEAYFEVRPDTDNPFSVKTKHYIVKVIGTKFFVSTSPAFEVIVSEGSVEVSRRGKKTKSLILISNEKAEHSDKQRLTKTPKTDRNFLAWKTGQLVFENTTLYEITTVLERTYNVKIEISAPEKAKLRMTASFDNQDISSVLKVIEATINVSINKTEDKYIIY